MRVARCGSRASCPCSRRVERSDRTNTPTEKNEMDLPRQYRASEELERFLGDPATPANVMSFHNVMQWDEQEAFPQAAVDELYRFGMNHHYVPVEYGGRFASYVEFQSLARVAARRDLTTAITFSTQIWSKLIWGGGTEQQNRHFAKLLRWTKEAPTLAYSEEQHGADLIANDLRAVKTEGGWRLTGEKWPITRATRSGVMAVLATPGEVGEGRELALRAFQVTRSLCAGLSLGAVDTALRTTLSFAMNRRLYGGTVFDIPMARQVLTDAFVDILICDCMATAAARGLHVATEQFSVWSAVVKYFVPTTLERTTQQLSVVLGARHFLRERHQHGIFQKMLRDGGVVSLFDGSTQVCLHALGLQLRHLVKARRREDGVNDDRAVRLATVFDLDETLPPFDGRRRDLFSRGRDDVIQGFGDAVATLHDLCADAHSDEAVLAPLQQLARRCMAELHDFDAEVEAGIAAGLHPQSPALFRLAQRYCVLHAAAACLQMWLHNRTRLDDFFASGAWLLLALDRLLNQLSPLPESPSQTQRERVAH